MLANTIQELDQIKNECRSMVTNSSMLSASAEIVPVPGFDIACDVALLMELVPKINHRFGLSREDIEQLDPQKKAIVITIIEDLGAGLVGKILTKELIMQVLKRVGIRMTAKQVVKYIPLAGQAAAAGLSFAAMQFVGNSHVDDCYKVAKRVIEKKALVA